MATIHSTLSQLKKRYPDLHFKEGALFAWSPKETTITYTTHYDDEQHAVWALIHEVAHASLAHQHYKNDIDLLRHEVSAWTAAKDIAQQLQTTIDEEHIQDCLDTYRDWVHKRATCPHCSVVGLQRDDGAYSCFNCRSVWKVPSSPLCRVSRTIVAN